MIGDRHMPGAMHSASGAPGFDRIEVVTGVERRRHWSLGEKLKLSRNCVYRA